MIFSIVIIVLAIEGKERHEHWQYLLYEKTFINCYHFVIIAKSAVCTCCYFNLHYQSVFCVWLKCIWIPLLNWSYNRLIVSFRTITGFGTNLLLSLSMKVLLDETVLITESNHITFSRCYYYYYFDYKY